jgi:hypothetical protein
MTQKEKQIAREAFDAGMSAQKTNDLIDKKIDEGVKQCPEYETFETYMFRLDFATEKLSK